jgi:hypothetical protein
MSMSMSMSTSMSNSKSKSKSNRINMSVKKAVEECGKLYNFDVEEALRALNIEVKKEKKVEKSKYPMPFNGEKKENCCNGIVKNHGLYTQCEKKVKEGLCKVCEKTPYGTIDERITSGIYEYKDPKGKSPKRYTEVLKKLKLTKETVEEEAKRLNITINPIHFEEVSENSKRGRPKSEKKVKEPTGKKGRPKKEKKVLEVNNNFEEEDLFATLIANANAKADAKADAVSEEPLEVVSEEPLEVVSEEPLEVVSEEPLEVVSEEPLEVVSEEPKKEKKTKKIVKEVDPAKEAEKQKKAEEKLAKEAEKQKKAEEKLAKEAEKQKKSEEKLAKEAEKQKKAEEKLAKESEKQKKAEEKAAKEAEKQKKSEENAAKEAEADVVRKIEFEGKSYYKSKNTGVIYNMEQEVVGKWNEERNEIDFEEEEEEEEYDD